MDFSRYVLPVDRLWFVDQFLGSKLWHHLSPLRQTFVYNTVPAADQQKTIGQILTFCTPSNHWKLVDHFLKWSMVARYYRRSNLQMTILWKKTVTILEHIFTPQKKTIIIAEIIFYANFLQHILKKKIYFKIISRQLFYAIYFGGENF